MVSSFLIAVTFFIMRNAGLIIPAHIILVINVAITSFIWIIVTYLTKPTDFATLSHFYQLVRPFGSGWKPIQEKLQIQSSPDSLPHCLLGWILGCLLVYSALFGMGNLLYGKWELVLVCAVPFMISIIGLVWLLRRMLGTKLVSKFNNKVS
jgi:SSS family solute:Na+ symporter